MRKTHRVTSCIIALVLFSCASLWAQDFPEAQVTSAENDATVGFVLNEADHFMSLTGWNQVKFDKVFVYGGFKHDRRNYLDFGTAFKVGPLYMGALYTGELSKFKSTNEKSVITEIKEGSGPFAGTILKEKITTGEALTKGSRNGHNFTMLVGFGNIGVNFGYEVDGNSKKGKYFGKDAAGLPILKEDKIIDDPNLLSSGTIYSSTTYSPKGFDKEITHTPYLGFGMNLKLGNFALTPFAKLAFGIHQEGHYGEETVFNKTNKDVSDETKTVKAKNDGYLALKGALGTGFALGDALNSTINFGYKFDARIYSKNYKGGSTGNNLKVKGFYEIEEDTVAVGNDVDSVVETKTFKGNTTEKSFFENTIDLGYSMTKDFSERLSFNAGFQMPITMAFGKNIKKDFSQSVVDTKYKLDSEKHNDNVETTISETPAKTTAISVISFNPSFAASFSYQAVPKKLVLSAGTKVYLFSTSLMADGIYISKITETQDSYVGTDTTTTKYADGRETKSVTVINKSPVTEKSTKSSGFNKVAVDLKGGLKWNISENVIFDFVYMKSLIEKIDLTELGNIKLACTVKF